MSKLCNNIQKHLEKRQVSVSSDTNTSQENLDYIEHEMDTRLTNLRRELVRRYDNSLVSLRDEIHALTDSLEVKLI